MSKVNLSQVTRESIEALKVMTSQEAITTGLLRTTEALVSEQMPARVTGFSCLLDYNLLLQEVA